MNWKYVKALLIVLLLSVNVLLGYLIYSSYSETAFTDELTALRAERLLEKSGIYVDGSMLAVKNDEAKTLSADYQREDYLLSVAAFMLGKEPQGAFLLPNGVRAESADGESVFVGSDMTVHFAAVGIDENTLVGRPVTNEEEAEGARADFAALLGYSTETLANSVILKSGDIYLVTLSQSEEGIPLYGCECTFGIKDGRLVYASGKHFFGVPREESKSPLLNRVNILFSEKARGKTGTVVSISLCYALYEDAKLGKIYLSPAYEVRYTDGTTSIINAKSAEIFE